TEPSRAVSGTARRGRIEGKIAEPSSSGRSRLHAITCGRRPSGCRSAPWPCTRTDQWQETPMKVGTSVSVLQQPGRPDAEVIGEHYALADLAEPLGFDSIFALEHHFTGYSMSPSPTQTLAYFAGRTKRVQLGTAVIVLPWHDPVRVAEQIALLDIMCGGRCLFGFGRGAATVEYEGFRIPMGEARPRFAEAAEIVVKALSNE